MTPLAMPAESRAALGDRRTQAAGVLLAVAVGATPDEVRRELADGWRPQVAELLAHQDQREEMLVFVAILDELLNAEAAPEVPVP